MTLILETDDGYERFRDNSGANNLVWSSNPNLRTLAVEYVFRQGLLWSVDVHFAESQESELQSFLTKMYGKPSSTIVDEGNKKWVWRRIAGGTKEVHLYSGDVKVGVPSGLFMSMYDQAAWSRQEQAVQEKEESDRKAEQAAEQARQARAQQARWQAEQRRQSAAAQENQAKKTTTYGLATTLIGGGLKGYDLFSIEVQQAEYDLVEYLVLDRYTDRLPVSLDRHFIPSPDEESVVLDLLETEKTDSQTHE